MRNLRELRGQAVASRMLEQYVAGYPPPLMIFSGPEGTGRWSAAEAFMQQQMCEVASGCGNCAACRKILRGEHPDLIQFPEGRTAIGEPEDPEEFTIRWLLQTRLRYTPFAGSLRFVLFPRADLIQHEAETALLKTLEEPPEHTRFIFLVRSLDELKPTIVSRGISIPFRLLNAQVMRDLAGGLGETELNLLGGSLQYAPLLATPFYKTLQERIDQATRHPQSLAEFERWIRSGEKKAFADLMEEESYSYEEILEIMATLFLIKCDTAHRDSLARAVFDFKGALHREQSGLHPYLLSRLFFELGCLLHPPRGGRKPDTASIR